MKKSIIIISAIALLLGSCKNETVENINSGDLDTAHFLNELKSIDSVMKSGIPEKGDIKKAIVMYQDFANYFPNDLKAPNYLFQVSDFHLNLGSPGKSIKILTDIIEKYPNYKRIEAVYFARASHTDFDVRDTTLAKTYYKEFLEKYPESQYADDAQIRYENVGLSIEDLIKQFDEKNAEK